ncbi:UNVERIFIED_CONTAM: hypothetical protein H355_008596 [Colinus virginianus]|nr:hypothetical protein H355_008596 [Colinus virginianus]
MGNSRSGALSREVLSELRASTRYSEEELSRWYEGFQRQCPDGRIRRDEFERIYATFFPNSEPQGYARHVFRSFDTNDDGTLDFREYIIALHLTSSGKTHLKLEWAFSLFDVDRNGEVSKAEVLEIITGLYGAVYGVLGGGEFREYIIALHLTSSGNTHLKLEWAFSLFDVDRNGEVSKAEVLEIITVSLGGVGGSLGV